MTAGHRRATGLVILVLLLGVLPWALVFALRSNGSEQLLKLGGQPPILVGARLERQFAAPGLSTNLYTAYIEVKLKNPTASALSFPARSNIYIKGSDGIAYRSVTDTTACKGFAVNSITIAPKAEVTKCMPFLLPAQAHIEAIDFSNDSGQSTACIFVIKDPSATCP